MFTLVCWIHIMSWIMHLETRQPILFIGLSGLYTTVCNVSTREGPPHRKQAKKLAVAQKTWKSWKGRQGSSSHAVQLPRYRQCLRTSHHPTVRARSTPVLFGKGTPWGCACPWVTDLRPLGTSIKQWNISESFMFKVQRCSYWRCSRVSIPWHWSRGLPQM